jgi:DNA-binding NarL/FixJ family response regulator
MRAAESSTSTRHRVLVAEDDVFVRAGIESLFGTIPTIDVVATCASYDEAVEAIGRTLPDVVLTDLRMPPTFSAEGIQLAEELRASRPDVGVVVLSQYVEPAHALALVPNGSSRRAYLLKEHVADVDQIVNAIEAVAAGGSSIDGAVVDALLTRVEPPGDRRLDRLTARELEVLGAVARGLSNAAIADDLYIGERAVEKHINSIFSKLDLGGTEGTHRRVAAVLLYLEGR